MFRSFQDDLQVLVLIMQVTLRSYKHVWLKDVFGNGCELTMLDFLKKHIYPVGVDLSSTHLKLAQLAYDGKGIYLHSAGYERMPESIEPGTGDWQRWAAKTTKSIVTSSGFRKNGVITAMPPNDLFIEQIKLPRSAMENITETVYNKVKKRLPFDPANALVKHVITDQHSTGEIDVLVMAAERQNVDRHLAIYEKAGLQVKGITVWPLAMTNTYLKLFGRRQSDQQTVILLMDTCINHTNIVICKHDELLFARVIPIGLSHIEQGQRTQRLIAETDACCRYFESISGGASVQKIIFLAGRAVAKSTCMAVAKFAQSMNVPAQVGDVIAAVYIPKGPIPGIDRRKPQIDWAIAFGLSLVGANGNTWKWS